MSIKPVIRKKEQKVLVFPAITKPVDGKQVYFLFSLYQMEDLLTAANVRAVPFSPPHVKGITEWRGNVVPVVFLEEALGLETNEAQADDSRLAVIRSGLKQDSQGDPWCIIKVSRSPKMLTLPIQYAPTDHSLPCDPKFIRGMYDWQDGILLVLHLENILIGNKVKSGDRHVQ